MKRFEARLNHFCKGRIDYWYTVYICYKDKEGSKNYVTIKDFKFDEDKECDYLTTEQSKKKAKKFANYLNTILERAL